MLINKANASLSTVIYGRESLPPRDLTLCAFGAESGYIRGWFCPILDAD
ncbi:hypothetical protein KLVA111870_00105 [Klebsiella variicola]|nr:hypothetical protein SB5387_00674 [Klebsiella variicola]